MRSVSIFAFVAIALSFTTLSAQACPSKEGPPPEAIDACEALRAGDACEFEAPHGLVKGQCFTPDEEKPLACRPDEPRRKGGRQGPPPQSQGRRGGQ